VNNVISDGLHNPSGTSSSVECGSSSERNIFDSNGNGCRNKGHIRDSNGGGSSAYEIVCSVPKETSPEFASTNQSIVIHHNNSGNDIQKTESGDTTVPQYLNSIEHSIADATSVDKASGQRLRKRKKRKKSDTDRINADKHKLNELMQIPTLDTSFTTGSTLDKLDNNKLNQLIGFATDINSCDANALEKSVLDCSSNLDLLQSTNNLIGITVTGNITTINKDPLMAAKSLFGVIEDSFVTGKSSAIVTGESRGVITRDTLTTVMDLSGEVTETCKVSLSSLVTHGSLDISTKDQPRGTITPPCTTMHVHDVATDLMRRAGDPTMITNDSLEGKTLVSVVTMDAVNQTKTSNLLVTPKYFIPIEQMENIERNSQLVDKLTVPSVYSGTEQVMVPNLDQAFPHSQPSDVFSSFSSFLPRVKNCGDSVDLNSKSIYSNTIVPPPLVTNDFLTLPISDMTDRCSNSANIAIPGSLHILQKSPECASPIIQNGIETSQDFLQNKVPIANEMKSEMDVNSNRTIASLGHGITLVSSESEKKLSFGHLFKSQVQDEHCFGQNEASYAGETKDQTVLCPRNHEIEENSKKEKKEDEVDGCDLNAVDQCARIDFVYDITKRRRIPHVSDG